MLAISPPQFSNDGWLLEDPISHHDQENTYHLMMSNTRQKILTETNYSDSIDDQYFTSLRRYEGFRDEDKNMVIVKKMNHNARERDRRKRISTLYSNLRSLLPQQDQSKKLSIPATVSRVLKYIPELQKEVERLTKNKKNLMKSKISMQEQEEDLISKEFRQELKRKTSAQNSESAISTTQISDQEIVIQISIPRDDQKVSFYGVLTHLEMEGFVILSASRFESFEGRVFSIVHIQAQGSQVKDAEISKEKILSFFK